MDAVPEAAAFRVVVFASPDDPQQLLAALRERLHLTEIDARVRVRNLPGVLPERLNQHAAQELVSAVRSLGIDAEAIAPDDWPDLRHAPKAHHVRCTAAGLEVVPVSGTAVERIAWDRLALISIADVPLDESHRFAPAATGVIRGARRRTDKEFTTPVRGPEMWIVYEQPFGVVRIDHREMNYEYLGPRKSGSATANFHEFTADLLRESPGAYLTPTTRAFLTRESVEKYLLDSPERHRELVELHTILRNRIRRRGDTPSNRLPDGPVGKEVAMNPTIVANPNQHLVDLHEKLRSDVAELKTWLEQADEYGRPQFGQLGDRVLSIRRVIAEHFSLEDEGGYMSGPLAAAPHLFGRITALHADHPHLLTEFDILGAKLRECPTKYDCWGDARRDLQHVLDDLELHEHKENELWQEAFDKDTGPGD
jgi:hypothetical protein